MRTLSLLLALGGAFSCGAIFPECTQNSQCASGVCEGTLDRGNLCVVGTLPGEACSASSSCASGTCNADGGVCACFPANRGCTSASQCCSGACVASSKTALSYCACNLNDAGLCL